MNRIRLIGLSILLLLILGLTFWLHNAYFAVMALFGTLIYFYYFYQANAAGLRCMLLCGLLALLGFALLLLLSLAIWAKVLLLAGLAALSAWLLSRRYPAAMGPFFVMMIASLGGIITSQSATENYLQISYLATGMLLSLLVAAAVQLIQKRLLDPKSAKPKAHFTPTQSRVRALGYALTIGLAYWLNLCLPIHHYNWLTVAAAANLEANSNQAATKRYLHYLFGNVIGIMVVWLVTQFTTALPLLLLLSVLFLLLIAIVISRNYCLALAFATPLAIFLFDVLNGAVDNQLLIVRLGSILFGALLGIVADLLLNYLLQKMSPAT